jgi:hypothetical protein
LAAPRSFFGLSDSILAKHGLIICNLFALFRTLFAANSQIRIAKKVNPSDFCNRVSEHQPQNRTFQAKIPPFSRTLQANIQGPQKSPGVSLRQPRAEGSISRPASGPSSLR